MVLKDDFIDTSGFGCLKQRNSGTKIVGEKRKSWDRSEGCKRFGTLETFNVCQTKRVGKSIKVGMVTKDEFNHITSLGSVKTEK